MVDFNNSRLLDSFMYDCVLADYPRSLNRARIADLANGSPPYSKQECEEPGGPRINVNDLSLTRLAHDARSQYSSAFLSAGGYFTAKTDMGPKHKQSLASEIVTREANRPLKESIRYFEAMRSKFALLALHGISPAVWEDEWSPIPRAIGVEDALIPSGTLLGFDNLPFFGLRRRFTGLELQKMTRGPKVDPGWNIPLVDRCLEWVDSEMVQLMGSNWPEVWSPEKWQERVKEDNGFYASDAVPTIDCFDIYGYVEGTEKEPSGWVRRIILDSWSNPAMSDGQIKMDRRKDMNDKKGDSISKPSKNDFLYSSGTRVIGDNWQNIVSFQFSDLSAVAPFRYHSVRSLGWFLYAVCHLRNRLYCKFNEAVFEALLQYFKVKSADDVQRALKLELANMGIIDDTITPVPAAERWQVNSNLVELGITENQKVIDANSKAYTQELSNTQNRTEKTKFQVMAEVQSANALVASALNQAYQYQVFEYREIFRRLLKPHSKHPMARAFRANCLRQGVAEKILVPEAWDIQSERMVGGGNQTLEMLINQALMEIRPMLDPEPQRIVLRDFVGGMTKNPAKALELVPESPARVTSASHDAQLTAGTLMQGLKVEVLTGINHIEYIEAMIKILAERVQKGQKAGGVVEAKELIGMQGIVNNVAQHIKILAQDEGEKQRVKQYNDILSKLTNEIKAFGQRLQEMMKKQQEQGGRQGMDPKDVAKIQATVIGAKTKATIAQQRHVQKMAQDNQRFQQGLQQDLAKTQAEILKTDLETAANINRGKMESFSE